VTENPEVQPKTLSWRLSLRSFVKWILIGIVLLWLFAALLLVAARWIDPPTTAVHMERHFQAWAQNKPYHERYEFLPLKQISPDFQHAVVAAEDARFYQHHGFDWHAIQIAAEGDMEGGRLRGGSTITQQLVKNLFFGTGRTLLRKGVVEWGPDIYGAEAASRYYYRIPARNVDREQGARLAAILPLPLRRRPDRMNHYSELIQERMRQMGW